MFHLPIVACWLQVAVGQDFPLFPGPLLLSYASRYARPVCLASPHCTVLQNKHQSHTTHLNPVRKTVFCISIQTSSRVLEPTLPHIQWVRGRSFVAGNEFNCLRMSNAEIKNEWSYTTISMPLQVVDIKSIFLP